MKFIRVALASSVSLWAAGLSVAQDANPSAATEPAPLKPPLVWAVSCRPVDVGARIACVMAQSLSLPDSSEEILKVEVVPRAALGNDNALVRLSFAHGVVPSSQIGLQVDGGKLFKVPLQRSDANGLYTTAPIGADFVTQMRMGRALNVSFILSNGKVATLPVSLFGFTAAYDAIQALLKSAEAVAPH
ncbi:hypothetical protein GA830_12880 [Mesorhizobium sp. NBSH29]|uniref:invasion associated locus B family protein n=1 Tax=Mesorhizobium sp. NBSH29 TaxID=2654249 RepID=UPI0018963F72|nr:invasion associated locus B family protein [Mesorhizobium sp. NBSH29]QPC87543.1 hypothetical protein GA830_12880 [Mesorhizobium sp. NBSH29]